jgi:hypothetical protein
MLYAYDSHVPPHQRAFVDVCNNTQNNDAQTAAALRVRQYRFYIRAATGSWFAADVVVGSVDKRCAQSTIHFKSTKSMCAALQHKPAWQQPTLAV